MITIINSGLGNLKSVKIGYEPPQERWLKLPAIKDIIEKQKTLFDVKYIRDNSYVDSMNWRLYLSSFFIKR